MRTASCIRTLIPLDWSTWRYGSSIKHATKHECERARISREKPTYPNPDKQGPSLVGRRMGASSHSALRSAAPLGLLEAWMHRYVALACPAIKYGTTCRGSSGLQAVLPARLSESRYGQLRFKLSQIVLAQSHFLCTGIWFLSDASQLRTSDSR